MATRADGYEMYNPGSDSNTIRNNKDHSKYFQQDEKSGEYVLKEGYEQRFLGSGDYVDGGGAESTFSNDYDDMHDSYEPDRDKKVYGIYKKASQQAAPQAQQAPAPEPEAAPEPVKDKGPVEYSSQVASAKERVQKFKGAMDGNAGSTFSTSAPAETSAANPAPVSFAPAKIDTPAYNPDAGNGEEAQGFADKYKLNLINKGAGQPDFSGV